MHWHNRKNLPQVSFLHTWQKNTIKTQDFLWISMSTIIQAIIWLLATSYPRINPQAGNQPCMPSKRHPWRKYSTPKSNWSGMHPDRKIFIAFWYEFGARTAVSCATGEDYWALIQYVQNCTLSNIWDKVMISDHLWRRLVIEELNVLTFLNDWSLLTLLE